MKDKGSIDGVLLSLFFVLLTGLTAAGFLFHEWRPPVASEHGKGVDSMITYLIVVTGIVFIIGHAVLAFFIWKYSRPSHTPFRSVSPRAEISWALVPVLVMTLMAEGGVLLIGMPVWGKVYGTPPQDALVVEVVAKQFEWIIRYPGKDGKFGRVAPELVDDAANPLGLDEQDGAAKDDVVTRGALRLPVGRHVVVRLRSLDVLHSFSIPEFRIKQDVIPGYTASTQFVVERTGQFEIACAELCGLGHYRMRGMAIVLSVEEFKKWLGGQS